MEAAIASVYGAIAAVDVFAHEVMFDKLDADALSVGKPHNLIDTLQDPDVARRVIRAESGRQS